MKNDQILLQAMKKVALDKHATPGMKKTLADAVKSYLSSDVKEYVRPELGDECYYVEDPSEHYKIVKMGIVMEGIQLVDVVMTNGKYIGTPHYHVPITKLSKL